MASSRPFARSGFLIAMLVGAAIGALVARSIEARIGGADPEFVSILGAALGGILGRSLWTRVARARRSGASPLGAAAFLLARLGLCAVLGVALFGSTFAGGERTAVIASTAVLLVGASVLEYRTEVRRRPPATEESHDVR